MASNVNVLCPNGRRQTVKVSPNTRILEIIETVCQKQKFNSDEYNLKHQRTILDVQVPFRYANLPNNAKLELVKADRPRNQSGPTLVALQLPTGERVQQSFEPPTTLWEILQHWEQQREGPSLTCPEASSTETLHPVCIYMREEVIGEAWLKATTLKGLGLAGGKAVIRLLHRNVGLPPPPKPTPADTKPSTPVTSPAATPQPQMVESAASSVPEHSDQSTKDRGVSVNHVDTVSNARVAAPSVEKGDTPVSNEPAPTTSASDSSMDCATSDYREDSPMDVDNAAVQVEKGEKDTMTCESKEKNASVARNNTVKEEVVRPKETLADSKPSTSQAEGGCLEEEKVQQTMKAIENDTGLSLDEYAKRRIQSLLEKEEEMVTSMQSAMLESLLTQQSTEYAKEPEVRAPRPLFADFQFPESDSTNASKGKGSSGKGKSNTKQQSSSKPCDRSPLVFSVGQEVSMQPAEVPDEFFNVTMDDVRRMLTDLRHKGGESEKDLETRAMREAREKMKMRKYEKVVVRIHFPERVILQGFFKSQETVGAVKDFVKTNLADKEQDFYLYTTPPKTILKDMDLSLFKAKLFPAAMIYFGSKDQRDHYLADDVLGDLATLLQADSVVAQNMKTGHPKGATASTSQASTSGSSSPSSSSSSASSSGTPGDPAGTKRQAPPSGSAVGTTKVPKWFKMGKK